MKNIFRNIVISITSFGIACCLTYATMVFGNHTNAQGIDQRDDNFIKFSLPNYSGSGILSYDPIENGKMSPNMVVFADFGRLSSAFLLSENTDEVNLNSVIQKNKNIITVDSVRGIFSWYDPFTEYTLVDAKKAFRIKQITNGSLYIGRESDGTISLYSIDLVAELTFLDNDQDMTHMIVFPGMYVRFNPQANKVLRGADLFKVMLALKNADPRVNTGIEFVDPRIGTGGKDVFFMYRLPQNTRILFENLHKLFVERVKAVDELKEYEKTKSSTFGFGKNNPIKNPTKNMYRLLGELQIIFSKGVNGDITPEEFNVQVTSIIQKAKDFDLGDEAQSLVQKFLIDGRFVLFLTDDKNIEKYQALYNQAAAILNINPKTGKGRLLQTLSDIFSRNLIVDTRNTRVAIDTSSALQRTLSYGTIDTKDYFDISLYSFLILEKMIDYWDAGINQNRMSRSLLEDETLYQIYTTIFQATQRYVNGIEDSTMNMNAQKSLVSDFYTDMLRSLVVSLYGEYTENKDDKIFLKSSFVSGGIPRLSSYNHDAIFIQLINIHKILKEIFTKKIQHLYTGQEVQSRILFEEYLKRLEGFISMIDSKKYRNYTKTPFVSIGSGSILPKYSPITGNLVIFSPKTDDILPVENSDSEGDKDSQLGSSISRILQISENMSDKNITKTENGYKIDTELQGVRFEFIYNNEQQTLNNIFVTYGGIKMYFADSISASRFRIMFMSIPRYANRAEGLIKEHFSGAQLPIKVDIQKNQIYIASQSYPLIP